MDLDIHFIYNRHAVPILAQEKLLKFTIFYCCTGIRQADGLLVLGRRVAERSDPGFPSDDKVVKTCFPEHRADVLDRIVEQFMERTERRVPLKAQRATIDTYRSVIRRGKNIEDRDLRGWLGEFEPTSAPPLGREHPTLGELTEDFLEVPDGHLGRRGDLGCRCGLPGLPLSEKNTGSKGIFASLRHHRLGPSMAARHRLWSSGVTID
jgi:hypothetical protein